MANLRIDLTNDEMNLLCIYQKDTRIGTMDAIVVMMHYLESDETELMAMCNSLLDKLELMTDDEFDELEKFPDFDF